MRYRLRAHLTLPLALALAVGCSRDDAEPAEAGEEEDPATAADEEDDAADEGEALLAAEMEAYEAAKPVFETHCATCHEPGEPEALDDTLHHFSMEGYPFGGHHAHEMGEVIRAVLGADGSEATMPDDDPGALSDEEVSLVVAWSEAFDQAHAAGVGHHEELKQHGHDHGHDHGHGHGHDHDHDHDHASAEKVEVSADGTAFDPPVEKAQIPEGAWICDMGTVHYARTEKGDGTCPRCSMDLVRHED